MGEEPPLDERVRWFEEYTARLDQGVMLPSQEGVRYACPCCGYPTLDERGGYEICELCNWEDDGQDDPHADEVWGGPNQDYSLTQARENFKKYLNMYDPARPRSKQDAPAVVSAKRVLIQIFEEMLQVTDEKAKQELGAQAREAEDTLVSTQFPNLKSRY